MLDADVEVGGVDQTFNMLIGRQLMKSLKAKEKFVLTVPLLLGPDGQKMGKTAGNFIALDTPPHEMYGQIMSISDDLLKHYFELTTTIDLKTVDFTKPMEAKKQLAYQIVAQYWGEKAAKTAADYFEQVIQKKQIPAKMPTINLAPNTPITKALVASGLAKSFSDAKRLINQGAVTIFTLNGHESHKVESSQTKVNSDLIIKKGIDYIQIKIGKS